MTARTLSTAAIQFRNWDWWLLHSPPLSTNLTLLNASNFTVHLLLLLSQFSITNTNTNNTIMLIFNTHMPHLHAHTLWIISSEPSLIPPLFVTSSLNLHSLLPKLNLGEWVLQLAIANSPRLFIFIGFDYYMISAKKISFCLLGICDSLQFRWIELKYIFFIYFAFLNSITHDLWENVMRMRMLIGKTENSIFIYMPSWLFHHRRIANFR